MRNITLHVKGRLKKGVVRSLMNFSMLFLGVTAFAQTNITVGTGTSSSTNNPVTSNYGYNYTQQIYYASELTAQGVGAGQINKLRFYTTSAAPLNNDSWTVYIGHTAKTQFTTTTDWEVIGNLTQVFSANVTFPAANNWMEIILSTPFQWDGVSNIVIGVDENTASYGSLSSWRTTTTAGINRCIYYRNDVTNPNPTTPPTATGRSTQFPNLQLEMVPTIACTTVAHANAGTTAANVCTGGSATLSVNNSYFYSGITYQWQFNDGSGWNDIVGATASTYLADTLITSGDYQVVVGCIPSGMSDISAETTVTVNPIPVVVVDYTDIAACGGEPATVTASGADTYSWTPTTAVAPSPTSNSVNLSPTATTTYTVVGTTIAGCSSSASVLVTPIALAKSTVSYNPSENCAPGSAVTMTVADAPADITSGGTWEYRFMGPDGTTVLQDWSASNTFTFTPAADSTYGHFYQMRSTSCPDDNIDSVYTTIIIGFGADVAVTNFNCNSDGIITLSNPFGQVEIDTLYSNPLNNNANLPNFALTGNASIASGRLQLTPSATGNSGYGLLTLPGFNPGMNNSMNVSFKMTADMPINTYGTGGADGIAYSFGDDATSAANGTGHNGKGTKLRLSFDAAGNGSENGNAPGIYLVYGWTATNAFGPASTQTLAYSSNTSLWKIKTDVPVELSIDADGKATVIVDGTVVFDHVQLPAAYMNADVSSWKHLFSAATGGDAMRQAVSNLTIEAGNLNYGITPGSSSTPPAVYQSGTIFPGLLPGTYNIWISKDSTGTCNKNIGTYEILNINPVVDLGNDTTICEGNTLLLDAGNSGSTYVWSNSNTYTQTQEVSEAGSYICYVTDGVGCLGIGTINVNVNEAPSVTAIYAQGSFPMMNFSVIGAQNADTYDWNFGDGNSVMNGPSSISHMYAAGGSYTVTVTLNNDCGTAVQTTNITILDHTGIAENSIENLDVYPNPASSQIQVSVPNDETSEVTIYSVSGSLIQAAATFNNKTSIDVSNWESGIYFMNVTNQGKQSVVKFVVE